MLYRSFYKYSIPDTSSKLYNSLIRPHLEYASAVWSPHLAKDTKLLEDIQKFALKVCTKKWDANYNTLLTMCNLSTLADRRNKIRLCVLWKIISGDILYPNPPINIRDQHYQPRHLNTKQLSVQFAKSNSFKYSFFPETLSAWNKLNFDTQGLSFASFKRKL